MRPDQHPDLISRFAGELAEWEGGPELAEQTLKMLRSLLGAESAWVLGPDASVYAATRPAASVPISLPDLWARHLAALTQGRSVTALVPDVDSAVLTLMPIRSETEPPQFLGILLVEDPSSDAGSKHRLARLRRFATVLARVLGAKDLSEVEPLEGSEGDPQRKASKPA